MRVVDRLLLKLGVRGKRLRRERAYRLLASIIPPGRH
jgi:hypothetical protein